MCSEQITHTITINGTAVPVTCTDPNIDINRILNWTPFRDWASAMDPTLDVRSVTIQNVTMFGSQKVGFVYLQADVYRSDIPGSRHLPGVVFMRGPSVAVLLVLKQGKQRHTVLVDQARVPIGALHCLELPAGVLEEGRFAGVAAKEIQEEVGIEIEEAGLVDLVHEIHGDRFSGIYPSPGGCDETIKLYAYEKEVTPGFVENLQGRATGVGREGEFIHVTVVPLDRLVEETVDAKALCTLALYRQFELKRSKDGGES